MDRDVRKEDSEYAGIDQDMIDTIVDMSLDKIRKEFPEEHKKLDQIGVWGFGESRANEVSAEEEEVATDLWQALSEGNLLGDYIGGGGFKFDFKYPDWVTDEIDIGSISWDELDNTTKQNVVNHFTATFRMNSGQRKSTQPQTRRTNRTDKGAYFCYGHEHTATPEDD